MVRYPWLGCYIADMSDTQEISVLAHQCYGIFVLVLRANFISKVSRSYECGDQQPEMKISVVAQLFPSRNLKDNISKFCTLLVLSLVHIYLFV